MPCPSQFTLCHEKWADMTPTARGRVCAKCDRQLIDFTGMSEDEIRAYHLRNPGTCGLYSLSQFHRPGSRLAAAAAAAAIGLTTPAIAHAALQPPQSGITQAEVAPADSIIVKGTVVDSASNQPLAGAAVIVPGTRLGALTDRNGQFRLVVRAPVTLPLRLQALLIGYTKQEALIATTDSIANTKFVMAQTFVGITELVVVGAPQPAVPKNKPSVWRRLWCFLSGH